MSTEPHVTQTTKTYYQRNGFLPLGLETGLPIPSLSTSTHPLDAVRKKQKEITQRGENQRGEIIRLGAQPTVAYLAVKESISYYYVCPIPLIKKTELIYSTLTFK